MRYASFDPAAAAPARVTGWYDTAEFDYPNLPPAEARLELTDEQWDARLANPSGWAVQGGALVPYTPPAPPAPTAWCVPVPLLRQRLQAAGKWHAAATAIVAAPGLMLGLLTLDVGVSNTDADVLGLLAAIGADPAEILALP